MSYAEAARRPSADPHDRSTRRLRRRHHPRYPALPPARATRRAAARPLRLPSLRRPGRDRSCAHQDTGRSRRSSLPGERHLLSAVTDSLATAVTEIQQSLDEHIGQFQRHRDQIAHLTAGDRLYVPADIADLLDRLRAIGVTEQTIQRERDGWILLAAAAPIHVRHWIKEKTASLDDVEFQRLYLAFDQAQEWSPDDPRLEQLADDLISYLGTDQLRELDTRPPPEIPATAIALITSTTGPQAASHQRLLELVHERAQRRAQTDTR